MTNTNSSHSARETLAEWLSYIESIHFTEIDMGLTRIKQVAELLNIQIKSTQVITVAGTNGKGTTCAFLENALLASNQTVAVYSSPHIEHFNERLRIGKTDIDDNSLIQAFKHIEANRGDISLSYYEYTTLAALLIVQQTQPDFLILEVGLGGRLDATNMIDADVAVVTTIDLDHQAFLGDTREKIGFEKAGIMRSNTAAVVGDVNVPQSVVDHANNINANAIYRDKDFSIKQHASHWSFELKSTSYSDLVLPHIPIDNVATALSVLSLVNIPLNVEFINQVIEQTKVAGRTEFFKRECDILLDVGHNPQAARYLASKLDELSYRRVFAVAGMLGDKDITNALKPLVDKVDHWFFGSLEVNRGATALELASKINLSNEVVNCFDNVTQAFRMASSMVRSDDLILVYGSFYTVAEIRRILV